MKTGNLGKPVLITPIGGQAVRYINKTGAPTVKGRGAEVGTAIDNSVVLVGIDEVDCIGIFYEDGIADGEETWIVTAGIAEVLFINATTRHHFARVNITGDSGAVAGGIISEALPTSPFATDKHFGEIGHIRETIGAPGLAKVNLHFN
jgi:hypothetical protein